MKFDLVRPCGNCPFRTDVPPFIRADRVREILGDPAARGKRSFPAVSFICHKTFERDDNDRRIIDPSNQHCAGAAIILIRDNIPNDAMQLAERLLGWRPSGMDMTAPVYPSRAACIRAHQES